MSQTSILIVDDDQRNIRLLEAILSSNNSFDLYYANDGKEAIEQAESIHPDIVLLDVMMPKISGLEALEKIRARGIESIVVIITAFGSEETAIEALRLGANNYLKKPIHVDDLMQMINKYQTIIESRKNIKNLHNNIRSKKISIEFESNLEKIPQATEYLLSESSAFLSSKDISAVNLALFEIISNAFEHGNLAITYEEKTNAQKNSNLDELYRERLNNPEYANRMIQIEFSYNGEFCEWNVIDEGEGFDWKNLPNPSDPEYQMEEHGRGIFISSFIFDDIQFIGKGNHVRLRKQVN